MTTVYVITCTKCNTSVFSRATHDMRGCICGSIAIDGGLDYTKISFDPKMEPPRPFELEVPQTMEELYQDWNIGADKYGLIQPGLTPPDRKLKTGCMCLAQPIRSLKKAWAYIIPRRLTLKSNPRVHAWLWWNF